MSEITDLIDALRSGAMKLEEVAQRFRDREWPSASIAPKPKTYLEMAAAAETDPGPYVRGSFDEVDTAHFQGQLSDEEYAVLKEAALEAMRSQGNQS